MQIYICFIEYYLSSVVINFKLGKYISYKVENFALSFRKLRSIPKKEMALLVTRNEPWRPITKNGI